MTNNLVEKFEKLALAAFTLIVVVGCTVSVRTSNDFDPSLVGPHAEPGVASQNDVRAALGEPFAKVAP